MSQRENLYNIGNIYCFVHVKRMVSLYLQVFYNRAKAMQCIWSFVQCKSHRRIISKHPRIMKIKYILSTFFLMLCVSLWGQTLSVKTCKSCGEPLSKCPYKGKHLFQTDTSSYQISYFGTMDGYPIALRLKKNSDGSVSGWYKNINYCSELTVFGKESGSEMLLNMEIGDRMTTFSLNKTLNGLEGVYQSSKTLPVSLDVVEEKILSGNIGNSPIHIMLWKDSNNRVSGIYYYDRNSSKKKSKYLILKGEYIHEKYELQEYNLKGFQIGSFSLKDHSANMNGTYSVNNNSSLEVNIYPVNDY